MCSLNHYVLILKSVTLWFGGYLETKKRILGLKLKMGQTAKPLPLLSYLGWRYDWSHRWYRLHERKIWFVNVKYNEVYFTQWSVSFKGIKFIYNLRRQNRKRYILHNDLSASKGLHLFIICECQIHRGIFCTMICQLQRDSPVFVKAELTRHN